MALDLLEHPGSWVVEAWSPQFTELGRFGLRAEAVECAINHKAANPSHYVWVRHEEFVVVVTA